LDKLNIFGIANALLWFRLAKEEKSSKWFDRVFLCLNIGDCKAFRITEKRTVVEITQPSEDGRNVQFAGGHIGW
jgi:hypothetical protein